MSIDKDEEVYIDELNANNKNLGKKNFLNKKESKSFSILKPKLHKFINNNINEKISNKKNRRNKRKLKKGKYIIKSIPFKKKSNKIFI